MYILPAAVIVFVHTLNMTLVTITRRGLLTMRKLCPITCHVNAEFTLAGSITTGKLCKQQLHVHVPHAVRRGNINNWNFWEKQNFNLSKSYIPFSCALHQNCTLVL